MRHFPTVSNSASPSSATDGRRAAALGQIESRKWAGQRARSMTLETFAPLSDYPVVGLPLCGDAANLA